MRHIGGIARAMAGVDCIRRTGVVLCVLAVIGVIFSLGHPSFAHTQTDGAQFAICADEPNPDCADTHSSIGHCETMTACQFSAPIESGGLTFDLAVGANFHFTTEPLHLGRTYRPDLQPPQNSIQA